MVFRKMRKHSGPWRQGRSGVLNTHDEQRGAAWGIRG